MNTNRRKYDVNHFTDARKLVKRDVIPYFLPVIEKAQKACVNSGQPVENHFVEMHEMGLDWIRC